MLGWRVAISAMLIPALLGLFWVDSRQGDGAPLLLVFCLLLAVRSSYELLQLLTTRAMRPPAGITIACCVVVVLAGWQHTRMNMESDTERLLVSLGWIGGAIMLCFAVLFIREAAAFHRPGNSMESLSSGLLTVLYCGGLVAVASQFRWFPSPGTGYFALGSLIIAVKLGDITAYTFGRLWGRRKMAPVLSPGKTWMGAVGAIFGSVTGAAVWLYFGGSLFEARPSVTSTAAVASYGAAMGAIGLIGDLCESLIKRDTEQKDSAALMPGFGGLLDLLDSALFAAPFALAFWALWPPAV